MNGKSHTHTRIPFSVRVCVRVCVCVCVLLLFYHWLVEVLVKLFVQRSSQYLLLADAVTYITVCFDCYIQ